MAGTDEQFSFIDDEQDTTPPDATGERGQRAPPWKVLSVEDDRGYQASLTYGLRGLTVLGRPVELLSANSATEAAVPFGVRTETATEQLYFAALDSAIAARARCNDDLVEDGAGTPVEALADAATRHTTVAKPKRGRPTESNFISGRVQLNLKRGPMHA